MARRCYTGVCVPYASAKESDLSGCWTFASIDTVSRLYPFGSEPSPAGAPWLPASPTGAVGRCAGVGSGLALLEAGDAASCRSMQGSWGHGPQTPNCNGRGSASEKLWQDSHKTPPDAQLVIPSPFLISTHVLNFPNHQVLLTGIVWRLIFSLGPLKVFG